jgi:hypothetical protein
MTASKTGTSEAKWDERARKDPFTMWRFGARIEPSSPFLASSEEECQKLVQPVLDELQFEPDRASMLEVSCGAGRTTGSESLCSRYLAGDVTRREAESGAVPEHSLVL